MKYKIEKYSITHTVGNILIELSRPLSTEEKRKGASPVVANFVFMLSNFKPRKDLQFGTYYLPFEHFQAVVDLLRNEKPIYFSPDLKDFQLTLGHESVGKKDA